MLYLALAVLYLYIYFSGIPSTTMKQFKVTVSLGLDLFRVRANNESRIGQEGKSERCAMPKEAETKSTRRRESCPRQAVETIRRTKEKALCVSWLGLGM